MARRAARLSLVIGHSSQRTNIYREYTHDLTLFDGLPKPHKESHEVIAQRSKILPGRNFSCLDIMITDFSKENEVRGIFMINNFFLTGGIWSPDNCNARYSALIIIPYKDREEHLARLMSV